MNQGSDDVTVLSRRELYNQMWKTPATKLAEQYGLSDVGLAKVCRRHEIPRPPRGYWAKLAHGKQVQRPRLPKLDDEALEEIRIFRNGFFGGDEPQDEARPKPPEITVPDELAEPHSLVVVTKKYLRATKRDDDGLVSPDRTTCLDIHVAPASVDRALRIFDTIIKGWERIGGNVMVGVVRNLGHAETVFELHEDQVGVDLSEELVRVGGDPAQRRSWYGNWKYQATGKLVLQVGGASWDGTRHRWRDGKRQRLETMLGSLINGLVTILDAQRRERLDDQCIARQRAAVRQLREAAKRRQELEEGRRKTLSENVAAWQKANEIRSYLEALRQQIDGGKIVAKDPTAFAEWIDWATWYANFVDPLTPTEPRPEFVQTRRNVPIQDVDWTRRTQPVLEKLAVKDTDELFTVEKKTVMGMADRGWLAWDEICRVLDGLGYNVAGRYYDHC